MIQRIVLASNNAGKLAELQAMFAPLGIEHLDMPATPERIWQAIRDARGQ